MSGSGSKVNYSVRTSKSIERKMMCEMIACLNASSEYRYVGMGAKYFTDFILMHKLFGITDMVSLETCRSESEKRRFEFNKPFNCIDLVFKNTTEWLNSGEYDWKSKECIVWFDYDGGLCKNQINDVALCVKKLKSISLVFVSTSVQFINDIKNLSPNEKLSEFCKIISEEEYTKHLSVKDVAGKSMYNTIASIFNIAIEKTVSDYNKIVTRPEKHINVEQVAFFKYADSYTPMITLGWVVYNDVDKDTVDGLGIRDLPFFIPKGNNPYSIDVPNLTYKELALLNRNMPNVEYPIEDAEFFSEEEINNYKKIYRYYPTTIETGLVL